MSGPDHGDEDKGFLARWSQRKQEAKQPETRPDAPVPEAEAPPSSAATAEAAEEFDLSSLPKLEEMTGSTDITGFLRKGVPEHLRNAALRQSWALDPAIRNYVNPALEYAYDWNTPGGVPGSSEVGAGIDVARMVLQIMGGPTEASPVPMTDPAKAADDPASSTDQPAVKAPEAVPDWAAESVRLGDHGDSGAQTVSTGAPPSEGAPVAPQQPVRRHGSAKPTV